MTEDNLNKTLAKLRGLIPEGGFRAGQMVVLTAPPKDPDYPATLLSSTLAVAHMRMALRNPGFLRSEMDEVDMVLDRTMLVDRHMQISDETRAKIMRMGETLKKFNQTMSETHVAVTRGIKERSAKNSQFIFDNLSLFLEDMRDMHVDEEPMDKPRKNRIKKERFNPNAKDRLQQSRSAKASVKPNPFWKSKGS